MIRSRPWFWVGMLLGSWLVMGSHVSLSAQDENGLFPDAPSDSIFRPADRELRQALSRAEEAIKDGSYSDAITSLGKLLSEGATDDAFVPDPKEFGNRSSLKTEAERLLAELPQRGRDLYELNFGAEARALLAQAIKDRSVAQLTEVTRRFFLTQAGQEASILLGRLHLDQGRPLSAALMFRRVAALPASKAKYDPELSMLLSTSWYFANRPEDAQKTLTTLAIGRNSIKIDGEDRPLFKSADESLAWLTKLVGTPAEPRTSRLQQWCVFGGDETRNASVEAGMPLADFRWQALTVTNPGDGNEIRQIVRRMGDKGEAALPTLHPLAVDDIILMRTTDGLTGIHSETGKLRWVFPPYDSEEPQAVAGGSSPVRNAAAQRQSELQQRLFEDSAYGQISSDGEAVYLLHELRPVPQANVRRMILIGGRPAMNPGYPTSYNQLVSLDLKKQGKLRWIVGDKSGEEEPRLAGAFFLGPPLPHQGELLTLAEQQGEIRLVSLDAKTGRMQWSQQIAHMDELKIDVDSLRRLAGVTPSFSDGLVVCPTAGGAVVAVDWARRSLSWGYSYARDVMPATGPRQLVVSRLSQQETAASWPVAAALIAEGCVVLTPPDSTSLHCLDLLTGKPLWAPLGRKDKLAGALYVGCVHKGEIILVCNEGLKSVNLKTGKVNDLPQAQYKTSVPSGRGVYSNPYYYLPLQSADLLKINLNDGTIEERLQTDRALGNLVIHDVDLISLSADALSTYYLREPLKQRIDQRLLEDGKDSWALARKGEILVQEGKTDEALKLLRDAYTLLPENEGIRNTLLKLLLTAVKQDYSAHAGLIAEIENLIQQPSERADFLRVIAPGLAQAGATKDAFEAYLALALAIRKPAAGNKEDQFEELGRQWRVRTDRWLATRLAQLYVGAAPDMRTQLDAVIAARLNEQPEETQGSLLRMLTFYPDTTQEQLGLASQLLEKGNLLQAEYDLTPLTKSSDARIAGPAVALLAKILVKARRTDEAIAAYEILGQDFANIPCDGTKTGAELLAEAKQLPSLQKELPGVVFQGSRVTSGIDPERASRFRSYQRLMPISIGSAEGWDVRGQMVTFDQSRGTIVVGDGYGRPVSEALLNQEGIATRTYFGLMSAASYGHMLTLSMGTEVIALDTLRGPNNPAETARTGEAILWRHDTVDRAPNLPYIGYGMQSRQMRNPLAGPTQLYTDQNGKPMGPKVALGPWGCAFFRSRQLVCVDPLSGESLWERSGMETGADMFGDGDRLFVVPHGSGEAQVYSAWDGALLGQRNVEKLDHRWATCEGNVLSWQESGDSITLLLNDAWTGDQLWKQEFTSAAKGCLHRPDEVAVMEPLTGELVIVSLRSGQTIFKTKLQPEPNLSALIVQESSNRYLVMPVHASQEPPAGMTFQAAPQGVNSVLSSGWIYAFDRQSGASVWQAPAYVHQHGYMVNQPSEMPVLLFLRHSTPTRGSAAKTVTSVLCIDKRTGAKVLEDDFPSPIHAYEVLALPTSSEVKLTIYAQSQRSYTVAFDNEPAPPQAPAQLGPFSSFRAGGQSGTAVNVAGAVFDALNNAFSNPRPAPPPNAQPVQPGR